MVQPLSGPPTYGAVMPDTRKRSTCLGRPAIAIAAVALVSGASLLPVPAHTAAVADDRLHQRQQDTTDRLRGAQRDYDAASRASTRAQAELQRARTQLMDARNILGREQRALETAHAARQRARQALARATRRRDVARTRIETSRERIEAVRLEWKQRVVTEYETGGATLGALGVVLGGTDPSALMEHLAGTDALNASYAATVGRTAASLALQTALGQELADARAEVRARARHADRLLQRRYRAASAAQAARDAVRTLTVQRRDAATAAAVVRDRDARQLRRLKAEQARIERILRRRAAIAEATSTRSGGPSQQGPDPGEWPWPVPGWISTPFGWRIHPIYGYRSFHNGIDIAAACGTAVRAPVSGKVLAAYFQTAYGNRVLIDDGALGGVGTAMEYNHLERWTVYPGQRVRGGQIIGYVGNTGWSTGCHLHFTIYRSGTPVDPLPLLR